MQVKVSLQVPQQLRDRSHGRQKNPDDPVDVGPEVD
jgi:hypothetical protein